ncbi:MAG: hypothetical protein AVO33_05335 [delta proteobacterium ML8_F1]|nr:MAG: hypothetical protein AVO33_05335 [delta proteobacterium ML8_F1]
MKGLREIASLMNGLDVLWALGASSVLYFNGHPKMPEDFDIFVRFEDYPRVYQALGALGSELPVEKKNSLYHTQGFARFSCFHVGVDLIGGFNIFHAEGEYRMIFDDKSIDLVREEQGEPVNVMALEDWWILYALIPGREAKSRWVFERSASEGFPRRDLLERALSLEVPLEIREKIEKILKHG